MSGPRAGGAPGGSAQELVPLSERLRWLWLFRLIAVGTVLVFALPSRGTLLVQHRTVLLATACYLGLEGAMHVSWRLSSERWLRLFAAVLVADGLYLGWVAYVASRTDGPLRYLTLVHLIVVALLASYRTGVKLALWHSALALLAYHARAGHLSFVHPAAPPPSTAFGELAGFIWLFWLVTLATCTFSSVNERELRRRRYDLEALALLSASVEAAASPSEVAAAVIDALADTFGFTRLLVIAGPDEVFTAMAPQACAEVPAEAYYQGEHSIVGRSLRSRRTSLAAGLDPVEDPWLAQILPEPGNLLILPMSTDERAIGVIVIEHSLTRGSRVERRVVATTERFAAHAALALANAWLLEKVRRASVTDGLTGIANRGHFDASLERQLAQAVRNKEPVSLLLLDIDHFKRLNDEHGHQVGDEVLRSVASVLGSHARTGDLAARYGGEEFALVLGDCGLPEAASTAERLRTHLATAPLPMQITVTVGVASFPMHGVNSSELIRAADDALYDGKRSGRDRVVMAPVLSEVVHS